MSNLPCCLREADFLQEKPIFRTSTPMVPMMAVLITRSERSAGSGHDPRIMGPFLYHVAVVARRFSDGDRRRATWGVVVVAGLVSIPPFLEPVLATVCQRNIHCGHPWVELGPVRMEASYPAPGMASPCPLAVFGSARAP